MFLHFPALRRLQGARVTAVADPDAGMRSAAAKVFPTAAVFDDWQALLDSRAVDAVVIAMPNQLHASVALEALRRGKHVFVEKPIGIHAFECQQLLEFKERDAPRQVAMAGFNFRFHPVYIEARRRLLRGDVGDVCSISTVFAVPPRQLPAWKIDRRSGGGVFLDQLSHHADLVRFLVGGITSHRAKCVLAVSRSVRSTDDSAVLLTEMSDGLTVNSTLTLCSAEQDRIEFHGTRGKLVADRIAGQVWFEVAGGGYTRIDRADRLLANAVRAAKLLRFIAKPLGETGHHAALSEFVAAIKEQRPPTVDIWDGAESLAWVLAAERAAASGVWANVDREAVGLANVDNPSPSLTTSPNNESQSLGHPLTEHATNNGPVLPKAGEMPPIQFPSDRPTASVVLVASKVDGSVTNVVRYVRRQTLANEIEFIVVAPSENEARAIMRLDPGESETLRDVRTVGLGRPVHDVDAEAAHGLSLATAPVTCIIEDHAFPARDWVEQLVAAYRREPLVGAAGSCVLNANPRSGLSRMNLLIAYGPFMQPLDVNGGPPSNHNVSYRTDAVASYGSSLAARLSRTGTIMDDLFRRGFSTKIVSSAIVHHANPSRLVSSVGLRIDAGRLLASQRADYECWPGWKRLLYSFLSPAIAPVRFARLADKRRHHGYDWRSYPALAVGLLSDAIGQGLGFVLGPGNAVTRCREFELGRLRHLSRHDQRSLSASTLQFAPTNHAFEPGRGEGVSADFRPVATHSDDAHIRLSR